VMQRFLKGFGAHIGRSGPTYDVTLEHQKHLLGARH